MINSENADYGMFRTEMEKALNLGRKWEKLSAKRLFLYSIEVHQYITHKQSE